MQEGKTDTDPNRHNPPHIFDRIFKRLMHVSSGAIIQFINGLFGTAYALDGAVEYLATEHITDRLNRWITDIRILINHTDKYLIEVQSTDDDEMALRIFNYEYLEALKTKRIEDNRITLDFSRGIVIYVEPTPATPAELIVTLTFPDKSVHNFVVPTLKLLEYSIADLEERHLSILLPFYVLKLRKQVKMASSREQRWELSVQMKRLIEELSETIERSERKGLMSRADMRVVINVMGRLYHELYKAYPEFKETNEMVDTMILLEVDEAELAGEARGEARGEANGEAKKAQEIAQHLIRKGWDCTEIAETTGLDFSTVELLLKSAQA